MQHIFSNQTYSFFVTEKEIIIKDYSPDFPAPESPYEFSYISYNKHDNSIFGEIQKDGSRMINFTIGEKDSFGNNVNDVSLRNHLLQRGCPTVLEFIVFLTWFQVTLVGKKVVKE